MKKYHFTSQRLGFREWEDGDVSSFSELNGDPDVMAFFPALMSEEQTRAMVERIQQHFDQNGFGFYATDVLENGEFAGMLGLSRPRFESFFTPCVEIGWRLQKKFWGVGLATEGALACLDFGFRNLGLKEIYSFTTVSNKKSERVMQKIGMQKIGEFDHPQIADDSPLKRHVVYKIEKSTF